MKMQAYFYPAKITELVLGSYGYYTEKLCLKKKKTKKEKGNLGNHTKRKETINLLKKTNKPKKYHTDEAKSSRLEN